MFALRMKRNNLLWRVLNFQNLKSEFGIKRFSRTMWNCQKSFTKCEKLNAEKSEKKISVSAKLVNSAPKPVQPYLKLIRLDKSSVLGLVFWPCGWGIALSATSGCFPDVQMLGLFGIGTVIMRGAGCTINDMWDRDIDSKVTRTKDRPLANGDISMKNAWIFLAFQLSLGLIVLLQLNWYTVLLGTGSLFLVTIYPLMKRFTYWPSFTLGLTCNSGILLGYSAVKGCVDFSVCLPLYLASICWTFIYDTIYTHQDRVDDLKVGVKSTAIKFDRNTKLWLTGFATLTTGAIVCSGIINQMAWPYYVSAVIVSGHLARQISTVNIDDPNDCLNKFVSNSQIGFILFCGIVLGTLFKKNKKEPLVPLV